MTDKIINVESPEHRAELERRQHQRRREDQVRTLEQAADLLSRERRYAILQASAAIYAANSNDVLMDTPTAVIIAENLLEHIERRERERQGKDETK